jgi:hypothetical protein
MNTIRKLAGLAAIAALALPVLAAAQGTSGQANGAPAPSAYPSSASAGSAGVNTSGAVMDASQMPPGQVAALQAGDNRLVTNGPVPDTAENRAKYGAPMSNGGKRTAPAGN